MTVKRKKVALVLSGGGARAAYQIGVLKAISEILPERSKNPFPIIIGTSAGAINSAALAIYGKSFKYAVRQLINIWANFHVHHVFRVDAVGVLQNTYNWVSSFLLGGFGRRRPLAFLDRKPLHDLLTRYMPCERIQKSLDEGVLESIAITASGYGAGKSVTFFHSSRNFEEWKRWRREGKREKISIDHLMASSSIPFIFSSVRLGNDFYGDGSIRQVAPISPALHLGADKIMVIGTSQTTVAERDGDTEPEYPSLAQISGHILNSIFGDSMDADLERLNRINRTIDIIPSHDLVEHNVHLRPIQTLLISPSEDMQVIAAKHAKSLPRIIRFMLRGIGAMDAKESSLISYLLFEKTFCQELIDMGYKDAMNQKDEIKKFFELY